MQKYYLFIGIDISKRHIDVALTLDGKTSTMPHQRFNNNAAGFWKMLKFIQSHHSAIESNQWFFLMEHTGVYTMLICRFLQKQQLDYTLVSGHHLARSMGLRRGKSDSADAKDIARYTFLHRTELQASELATDNLLKIKSLLSFRRRLVENNKSLKTAAGELKSFSERAIHQHVSQYSKKAIAENKKLIRKVEAEIRVVIKSDDELQRLFDLVTSIKGVALIIGAHLLVFTNGFKSFTSARKFASYIGIAPFGKTSGDSVYVPPKVSHLAHKKLKGVIANGVSSAIRYDKELNAYYQRRITEKKNKYAVRNAVMNKFILRIFAVVKRGTPYVELHQFKSTVKG